MTKLKTYGIKVALFFCLIVILQPSKVSANNDTEVNVIYDAQNLVYETSKLKIVIVGEGRVMNDQTGAYVQSGQIIEVKKDEKLTFHITKPNTLSDVLYDKHSMMKDIMGNELVVDGMENIHLMKEATLYMFML